MTQDTLERQATQAKPTWESLLVLSSVTLLSGLAVADRVTAWLIGEFPAYPLFWRLRFEFLRPIGVYYDMAERQFGAISPAIFSALAFAVAALIAAGVVSRVRLARALSCHLILCIAMILVFMSWNSGFTMRAHGQVGMTSEPYAMLGTVLAAMAAGLCLRIHAEYVGLTPASSRRLRRARIAALRLRARVTTLMVDMAEQLVPAPARSKALVIARIARYRDHQP